MRSGWVPSLPRGLRCPHGWHRISSRRMPLHNGKVPEPRYCFHHPGLGITRHHRGFTVVHPSDLPQACDPRMEQESLGLSPELHTPPLPATHVEVGTDMLGTCLSYVTTTGPPIYVTTQSVRPRGALRSSPCLWPPDGAGALGLLPRSFTPRRYQRRTSRWGQASSTGPGLHCRHRPTLQSASPLILCDLVSQPQILSISRAVPDAQQLRRLGLAAVGTHSSSPPAGPVCTADRAGPPFVRPPVVPAPVEGRAGSASCRLPLHRKRGRWEVRFGSQSPCRPRLTA